MLTMPETDNPLREIYFRLIERGGRRKDEHRDRAIIRELKIDLEDGGYN